MSEQPPRRPRRRRGAAAERRRRIAVARRRALAPGMSSASGDGTGGTEKSAHGRGRALVIACGALAREIRRLIDEQGRTDIDLQCLPADWHNTPRHIPAGVRARIRAARAAGYDRILVAYGDCGTGGGLDMVLAEEGVARLPGPHCYAFLSGTERFLAGLEADARSYFLTDYLARHFDSLIWRGMMLDRHPQLLADLFGNYERLVHLAQRDDPALEAAARDAARRLGLRYEKRFVGHGDLGAAIAAL